MLKYGNNYHFCASNILMAVKIFKAVWFFSVLAVLVALLYQYASHPEQVVVGQGTINFISLTRDQFFYVSIAVIIIINVTVYIVRGRAGKADAFVAWYHGFIAVVNFFLIIALSFIALFNSSEKFNTDDIGKIVFGSMFLLGAWILGGLLFFAVKRLSR
jgi:hypothetical protein